MPAGASERFKELARARRATWGRLFADGERPSFDALDGFEYRVWNATPALLGALRLRKLIKVFFRGPDGRSLGCNVPVEQNGLDASWIAKPRRFGFFEVRNEERRPQALVLDYRVGLRDYVTRIDPGSDEILLGRAYLGLRRVEVPVIWFLLERHGRIELEKASL